MAAKFADLLKQLETEHHKLIEENSDLRTKLANSSPIARKSPKGDGTKSIDTKGKIDDSTVPKEQWNKTKNVYKTGIMKGSSRKNILDISGVKEELQKQIGSVFMKDSDASGVSLGERIFYCVENMSSMTENFFFYILVVMTVLATIILGIFWKMASEKESQFDAFYYYYDMFQVISTGGIDDTIRTTAKTVVYTVSTATGLIIFAILIGIITDKFQNLINAINEGRSTVPEKNHTLLLGWNESTERVVCQLAFLRRQYIIANSGWMKKICWWTRIPPATPVAKARIVILCDNKTKPEMHEAITSAFEERGISPKRTRVGWDVICRVGDPTNPQDLQMVGAHNAVGIAVMMTVQDLEEEEQGGSSNAATFRTILALRKVLFAPDSHPPWQDLRIVVPLSRPSKAIHSAAFCAPVGDEADAVARQLVMLQDLSIFLNTLIFTCSTQPGLANVFMELMSFDGVALRLRKVKDFPSNGEEIVGKTFEDMAQYWDNAILVGVVPSKTMDAEKLDPENGMAPCSSRKIRQDDRVVFISERSLPTVANELPPPTILGKKQGYSENAKKPMKILVCGFRKEWKDPARFAFRLHETGKPLASDSYIHFLNQMDRGDFLDLMEKVVGLADDPTEGIAPIAGSDDTWMLEDRIRLGYTEGDSTHFDTLEEVIVGNDGFDVTIVVPPVNATMSAQAQDTRLMSIMCTLRTICEDNGLPLVHVIGENKLESSAQLAIRPKHAGTIDETDFVNVQAIIARALCQAMAFPFMQPSVVQLFSSEEASPSIHLCPAALFVPFRSSMFFADLIAQVKKVQKDAICIGYRLTVGQHAQTTLCPRLSQKCSFNEGDVVIVISRVDPSSVPQTDDGLKRTGAGSSGPPQVLGASQDSDSENMARGLLQGDGMADKKKAVIPKKKKQFKTTKQDAASEASAALVEAQQGFE